MNVHYNSHIGRYQTTTGWMLQMLNSVNAWIFPKGTPIAQQARLAAEAGFQALELCFDEDGEFSTETPAPACRGFGHCVRQAGLEVASLATGLYWRYNFGHPDPAVRAKAHDLSLRGLDRAAWIGAGALLVIPAVVGSPGAATMNVSYADALNRTFDALCELSAEAEARGVAIAIENVRNRFLLSPVEARDLIDQINCPQVGFCFDVGEVMTIGYPQDWICILAQRIQRVHLKDYDPEQGGPEGFCPLGDGHVDWPAVMAALRETGYDGPLTYEGAGDLTDVRRRIDKILALGNLV